MSVHTYGNSSGESVGANVLTIAVIVGSAFLLMSALAGFVPVASLHTAQVAKPVLEQVVVTAARPHHVS
jgi:hypothetical protein